jgi:hypothetical protein
VKRLVATALTAAALLLSMFAGPAAADPSFGPGNSNGEGNNSPHEMEPNCHAPGQSTDLPQCR